MTPADCFYFRAGLSNQENGKRDTEKIKEKNNA